MNETKRKLLGLFRTKSSAGERRSDKDRERHREDEYRDRERNRERRTPRKTSTNTRKPSRSHSVGHLPPPSSRSSVPDPRNISMGSRKLLTTWPPPGMRASDSMTPGKAMELVASGAPVFKGYKVAVEHVGEGWDYLFAAPTLPEDTGDARLLIEAQSFKMASRADGEKVLYPWETLEQPSMAFCHAARPGTCMLNFWIAGQAKIGPTVGLKDLGAAMTREVELGVVVERLSALEKGVDDDEEVLYRHLYKTLLRDPERKTKPHKAMEKQIADLIVVLSSGRWTDFSRVENQVVAKWFMNEGYTEQGKHKVFFHQLLLAMELEFRIQSPRHGEAAKQKLLAVLPERVKWDLVLARRWKEGVSIEMYKPADGGSESSSQLQFNLKKKRSQIKRLKLFARTLKWPNLPLVEEVLKNPDSDPSSPLERTSSDAMSFFTNIILPGPTTPFLLMNTLIDIDRDASPNLAMLTHMFPNCGFQYKSQTYWSSSCIVGKVLAPTCKEIGGWIGPGPPVSELQPSKIARIRQRRPRKRLEGIDVSSMTERSLPLGPPAKSYPVSEYSLLLPDLDPDSTVDLIRIETLFLKPISNPTLTSSPDSDKKPRPATYDACIQFAVDGQSWPLRLSYDVAFILACPCKAGPHPLFFDYAFQTAKVDTILRIRDWGGMNARGSLAGTSPGSHSAQSVNSKSPDRKEEEPDEEKVLVVEAFGVPDNEVLARAWCVHWGLSALVADVERTCVGCAVREAYAACVNVVILVEGSGGLSDDD